MLIAVGVAIFLLLGVGVVAAVALSNSPSGPEAPERPQTQAPQTPQQNPQQTPPQNTQPQTQPQTQPHEAVRVAPPTPPAPHTVRVRVVADGRRARSTVAFRLHFVTAPCGRAGVRPAKTLCDCRRDVEAGAAIRVTVQGRRVSGTATATPARDDEEIHVAVASAPAQRPAQERREPAAAGAAQRAHGECPLGARTSGTRHGAHSHLFDRH